MRVFTREAMKHVFIGLAVLLLTFFCVACSPSPSKINVVGMSLDDACEKLYEAGWAPHPVDETPYSDYVPGAWENGVEDYNDCAVSRVDFSSSESSTKSTSSRPVCKVYFKSNSQSQLEEIYDLDLRTWLSWYEMLTEQLAETGPTKKTIADITQAYNYILDYDIDKVPDSRKDLHQQIIGRFEALLDRAS